MFQGGPWRSDVLEPTEDFWNFRDELKHESEVDQSGRDPPTDFEKFFVPRCAQVEEELQSCCGIELYPVSDIPSYVLKSSQGRDLEMKSGSGMEHLRVSFIALAATTLVLGLMFVVNRMKRGSARYQQIR